MLSIDTDDITWKPRIVHEFHFDMSEKMKVDLNTCILVIIFISTSFSCHKLTCTCV